MAGMMIVSCSIFGPRGWHPQVRLNNLVNLCSRADEAVSLRCLRCFQSDRIYIVSWNHTLHAIAQCESLASSSAANTVAFLWIQICQSKAPRRKPHQVWRNWSGLGSWSPKRACLAEGVQKPADRSRKRWIAKVQKRWEKGHDQNRWRLVSALSSGQRVHHTIGSCRCSLLDWVTCNLFKIWIESNWPRASYGHPTT